MSDEIQIDDKTIQIEQFRDEWVFALMKKGLLVKLTISCWKGISNLDFDALGIKFNDENVADFMQKYVKLGSHKMLPPDIIREITKVSQKGRRVLEEHSFNTVWGKFVPWTAFEEWEKENEVAKENFVEMVRNLGNRYDEIVARVKVDYQQMAKDSWGRLYPDDEGGPTEAFVTNFVNKIVEKIPEREELLTRFKYDTSYSVILMPSIVEENIEKGKEIQRESEQKDFELELEKSLKERLAEQYVQERQRYIDGFLESTVQTMRKYVAELCDSVLQSMGKLKIRKSLTGNHKKKIKKMILKVRNLNFYDDQEVSSLLNELETEVDKFKGEDDPETVIQKLEEIVKVGTEDFVPTNFNPAIGYLEP